MHLDDRDDLAGALTALLGKNEVSGRLELALGHAIDQPRDPAAKDAAGMPSKAPSTSLPGSMRWMTFCGNDAANGVWSVWTNTMIGRIGIGIAAMPGLRKSWVAKPSVGARMVAWVSSNSA